jgi:hypothetical protein
MTHEGLDGMNGVERTNKCEVIGVLELGNGSYGSSRPRSSLDESYKTFSS